MNLLELCNYNKLNAIFVLYVVLILTDSKLLSKQMQTFIEDNRMIQHIVGFIALFIILNSMRTEQETIYDTLLSSVKYYAIFLISTKVDIHWNIILLILLIAYYIYTNIVCDKNREIIKDQALNDNDKQKAQTNILSDNFLWIAIAVIVIIIGAGLYFNKKQGQYGGGQFDLVTYLFY